MGLLIAWITQLLKMAINDCLNCPFILNLFWAQLMHGMDFVYKCHTDVCWYVCVFWTLDTYADVATTNFIKGKFNCSNLPSL